jgi:hypothetical protein
MTQLVGEPIEFDDLRDPATGRRVELDDLAALRRLHRRVARTVHALLDTGREVAV